MNSPIELEEGRLRETEESVAGTSTPVSESLSPALSIQKTEIGERKESAEPVSSASTVVEPPDGGYGWVVAACQFTINAATWGNVTSFGVFLSFYRQIDFFPGATDVQFAMIGGLCVGFPLIISPGVAWLSKCFGFRWPMGVGILVYVLAQILAAFSTRIWELFLTQGVMLGLGIGLIFIPTVPILSHWFTTKRAVALGAAAGGSGGGALVLCSITRASIQNLGLRWAFIINALITLVTLTPAVLLMRDRNRPTGFMLFTMPHFGWLVHPGFLWVALWTVFAQLGYVVSIFTVDTYATAGLGLSQIDGANLQVLLAAGQMLGRPLIGFGQDRWGRINVASAVTFLGGLFCLVVWVFARSYGLMVFFALLSGVTGGIFWSAGGPVAAEVAGLPNMAQAMTVLWLVAALPAMFAEPMGVALVDYAQTRLHLRGADQYLICIGFAGGCFVVGAALLLGAKRHLQGNWDLLRKS